MSTISADIGQPPPGEGTPDEPRIISHTPTRADRRFRRLATGAGLATFAILALIGLFLLIKSWPAFHAMGLRFFTTTRWDPEGSHVFGVAAILYWTLAIAVIALVIAVPFSIATALFITEYAPPRLRRWMTSLVDLLAAIPSVIYGIWGLAFLEPRLVGTSRFISKNFGFIPIFKVPGSNLDPGAFAASAFVAGVIVSLMVLPTCTSVVREVFAMSPPGEKEAAFALGGSRWSMIRRVVLPFGRGGIIGGAMLGLGRALGETIAVALVISPIFTISIHVLAGGANGVGPLIALRFGDATQEFGIPALMAAGLTLFVFTLLVNLAASAVVARTRSGTGVEI
jgi:phosphate transport system permease protein